jgi:transcriptional regulator with XRE-family HTH domain
MLKIGETIKELRKKSSVTQEKLVEYLGVTLQAVSRWKSLICYVGVKT